MVHSVPEYRFFSEITPCMKYIFPLTSHSHPFLYHKMGEGVESHVSMGKLFPLQILHTETSPSHVLVYLQY